MSRIFTWIRFVLSEYSRSGRILVELTLGIAFWGLFFQNRSVPITQEQMFSLTGLFSMALALYTTSAMLALGDRPQSYIILSRAVGRRGFLLGLYGAAVLVVWGVIALLIGLTLAIHRELITDWRLIGVGIAPLLLNVLLLSALMLLLSGFVARNWLRLGLLAILAIALYANTWNLSPAYRYLSPLQSIFSRIVEPAIAGQRLAVSREYGSGGWLVLLSQLVLAVLLVSIALASFRSRELVLGKK